MEREDFYRKLIAALLRANFRFRAEDISEADVTTERDRLSSSIRTAVSIVDRLYPIVTAVVGVDAPVDLKLHPVFDRAGVHECLDSVREYAPLVCCKYLLAQPVIVAVVEADELAAADAVALARKFDQMVLEMRRFTGKIAYTRLSVTGIIFFTFFDHASAAQFSEYREKCKIFHFFRKTWVLPWMIDVAAHRMERHAGIPIIIRPIIDTDRLAAEVFGA
jgi:hypothetical protein